jgi:hypothetical protein
MMASDTARRAWTLRSFLDSLTLELDRALKTVALKGRTHRLTYTVRDLALDLQLFPEFDGDELRFTAARPGETGAARVSLQLGSITDRQILESTKEPPRKDDIAIELIDDLDPQVKRSLEKLGVSSVRDLETIEKQNIDLGKVADSPIDYGSLARMIQRSKRLKSAPRVKSASLADGEEGSVLTITGENLAGDVPESDFPRAYLDGREVRVRSASATAIELTIPGETTSQHPMQLEIALDPYAILRMNLAN